MQRPYLPTIWCTLSLGVCYGQVTQNKIWEFRFYSPILHSVESREYNFTVKFSLLSSKRRMPAPLMLVNFCSSFEFLDCFQLLQETYRACTFDSASGTGISSRFSEAERNTWALVFSMDIKKSDSLSFTWEWEDSCTFRYHSPDGEGCLKYPIASFVYSEDVTPGGYGIGRTFSLYPD
jgi:hypothetical protein